MINNKRVLAITLARGGSSRIPKKNIVDINGKPLLQYTIDEVKKSKYIDDYIVSTDDDSIHKVCSDLNTVSFSRKPASDTQTTIDGIMEVINFVENEGSSYDYIVEVMCTNPLKTIEDIDGVIEMLNENKSESVVSVVRIWDTHPLRVKYLENGKLKNFYGDENPDKPNSRRQDLTPPAYVRNGSIYAMTLKQLEQKSLRVDENTLAYIMPEERTINIDEPRDLELAKVLLK
tara:strand:+ start:92 stop:787 length:696 start_codon:yes stop_codon:yes gene_type:complete